MYKGFYFRYICMVIRVVWLPPVLNNLAKKQGFLQTVLGCGLRGQRYLSTGS